MFSDSFYLGVASGFFIFGVPLFCMLSDASIKMEKLKLDAIKSGVAERVVNQETGEVSLVWKPCLKEER